MIRRKTSPQTKRRTNVRTYFLIFVCCLLTVTGFFFAGRQHFSWMDYGMKNSRLRKQIDDLQAEKRRLLVARETSLSPAEIKKAARKFLGDAPAVIASAAAPPSASIAKLNDKPQATPASTAGAKPMVVKTVAITPASSVDAQKRTDKPTKQIARVAKLTTTAE